MVASLEGRPACIALGALLVATSGCGELLGLSDFHAGGGDGAGAGNGVGAGGATGAAGAAGGFGGEPHGGGGTAGGGGSGANGGSGGIEQLGPFGTPAKLVALSSAADDDDPTFPDDRLEVYFGSYRLTPTSNIYVAKRSSPTHSWSAPATASGLNAIGIDDTNPVISPNGLTIWFGSRRQGGQLSDLDIYVSKRIDKQSEWSAPTMVAELCTPQEDVPGGVSRNGLRMLLISTRPGGKGNWDVLRSQRPSASEPWTEPIHVTELNSTELDGNGCFAPQALELFYFSEQSGQAAIYRTVRPSIGQPWIAPAVVSELQVTGGSSDPWLSMDRRYIMFAGGPFGSRDLYEASR